MSKRLTDAEQIEKWEREDRERREQFETDVQEYTFNDVFREAVRRVMADEY